MTNKISQAELREIYIFALDLGRRAGEILYEGVERRCSDDGKGVGERQEEKEKMNAVDIVTQTDLGLSLCFSFFDWGWGGRNEITEDRERGRKEARLII